MNEPVFGSHVPVLHLDRRSLDAALELSGIAAGERYVELGSGEGHGLIRAARHHGARARGIELMPHAVARTSELARAANVSDLVEVEHGDLMQAEIGDADVVLAYLGPTFHDLLAPRLEAELGERARVVMVGWKVNGWQVVASRDDVPIQSFLYLPNFDGPSSGPGPSESAPVADELVVERSTMRRGPRRGSDVWTTVEG